MIGRRSKAEYLLAALALLALLLPLSGCVISPDPRPNIYVNARSSVRENMPVYRGAINEPLLLETRYFTQCGCRVSYPYALGPAAEILNSTIRASFEDFVSEYGVEGGSVSCSVDYNRYGLLSLKLILAAPDDRVLFIDTANFNCDSGSRVRLEDCFGSSYTDYTSVLRGIVDRYVEQHGLSVVFSAPPIRNSSAFVFTAGGIKLIYREYELCTSEAGIFTVPASLAELSDCIAPNGLLTRLGG